MPSFTQMPQSSDHQGLNSLIDLSEPLQSPTSTSNHVPQGTGFGPVPCSQYDTPKSGDGGQPLNSSRDNDPSQSTEEDLPIRGLTDLTARRAVTNEKLDNLISVVNQIPELKARIDHVEESLSHSLELSAVLLSLIDSFGEQLNNNLGLVNDVNARVNGTTRVIENLITRIAQRRDHGRSG